MKADRFDYYPWRAEPLSRRLPKPRDGANALLLAITAIATLALLVSYV